MTESANGAAMSRDDGGRDRLPRRLFQMIAQVRTDIRRALGFGVLRASAPLRSAARSGGQTFARARLEKASIEERYSFSQEISQNPTNYRNEPPAGHIELTLPFDGDRYFTRQAYKDVARARHSDAVSSVRALVGYMALADYANTNLDSLLGLASTYGSVPIRVPLALVPGSRETDPLVADDSACVLSYDYLPDTRQLAVNPVHIDVQLDDLDTADFSPPGAGPDFRRTQDRHDVQSMKVAQHIAEDMQVALDMHVPHNMHVRQIMQHVGFRPNLVLRMMVFLHVPIKLSENALAEVSKVSLNWPTHTSLRSLELSVSGQAHPLRYNPMLRCLEWSDIPMTQDPDPVGGEIRIFRSQQMILSIPQPGELYREENLMGSAEVTVDRLLSGMHARLFDATGRLSRRPQPKLESVISTEFSLILDDAFGRRTLTPHQQLHFDEVIPSEMRIDDIRTALENQGFTVEEKWRDRGPEVRWLSAMRTEGPDTLRLELYVEGKLHKARRQRRVPGGMTYRTDLDSGEMRIYIYGSQPRDSQQVVHEMNELRRALHERFDRLPARR